MGPFTGPRPLLLAAVLIFLGTWALFDAPWRAHRATVEHPDELSGLAERYWQQHRRSQLSRSYANVSLDDSRQRAALLDLYNATNGPGWRVANISSAGAVPWGTESTSYCRWFGVTCCLTSPLSLVSCDGAHSVAILSLDGYGLVGSLPASVGDLQELTVLALANNPQLVGNLPGSLSRMPHLLWMSVEDSGILACTEASLSPPVTGPCTLPPSLTYGAAYNPYGTNEYQCPVTVLASFLSYTTGMQPDEWDILTSPFPAPPTPGGVIAGGNFTRFFNCTCRDVGKSLAVQDSGTVGAQCVGASDSSGGDHSRHGLVVAIIIVAIVPWLLVAVAVYVCVVHKATLNRLVRRKEAEMARKRSKVPGTPGVALQNGRGLLSLSDVMVTWVVTDVAASTQLWEWKPDVMDSAIDLHNAALRSLMDEFGGHEIRNEGDSFTLSFHDAVDAVTFCLKAQEMLMAVEWPKELSEHPRTSVVSVGDVTSNPDMASKGPPLITGLRVRMGINTGVPDDIFLHDLTDHVDYRGLEYDLAGEICDLAEGGQVLMGPRTLQRWNKVNYSALIDPLAADLMRDQQGGSFVQGSGQPPALLHGPSGRRGSITGFGGVMGGGMMGLQRDSQQLQAYYSSTLGVGMAGTTGGTGYPLSTLATMRRNSDSQPQQNSSALQTFARMSDADEGLDDDGNSSVLPSNIAPSMPAVRSLRAHRSSSPSRVLRGMPPLRVGAHSSDGTAAGPGPGTGPSGRPGQLSSPLVNMKHRSKLGSPRAIHLSSMSYDDFAPRARPVGSAAEDAEGRPVGRPVRRVSSTEGLLRLHAARAADMAAAASAAAMAAAASFGVGAAAGRGGRSSHGGPRGGGLHADGSDDERGSPLHHPSEPLGQIGSRLSNARASAGSVCDGGGGGAGRRRGDDAEYGGTFGTSAPMPMAPGLQRWLSHGWRGVPIPTLPRAQTATSASLTAAATAAAGAGGTGTGAGTSPVSGMATRNSTGGVSIGGRVLWSRVNGALVIGGVALRGRRSGGGAPAGVSNCGSCIDGPSSLPVVALEGEAAASGASGGLTRLGLIRISSLPVSGTGTITSGATRMATLQRRGVGSEAPSREGSLRHQNPLFLRNLSREGSRDSKLDPLPTDSSVPTNQPSPAAAAQNSPLASPCVTDADAGGGGGVASGPFPHPINRIAASGISSAALAQVTHPLASSLPGRNSGVFDAVNSNSRRVLMHVPGPPRISMASETGLHPLLLHPMQPGGMAAPPVYAMGGRLPVLRHPQQLMGRQAGPSPLGITAAFNSDIATGPASGGGHEHLIRTGDSITSTVGRGVTVGPSYRPVLDQQQGSADGGGGLIGGPRGDSGSLLKAPSIGHQITGPYAQLSYQHNTTQGGYYAMDGMYVDGMYPAGGAASVNVAARGGGAEMPLVLRVLGKLGALWSDLAGAFRAMLRRCLHCVRLLTSSDDDPADVDMWEHTDGTVLGGGQGAHKAAAVGSKPQETKGVLVDMGYYHFTSVDYNGQAAVGHYVHLMQIVPSSVAPRVLLFPWPLSLPVGWEKISPGFFDAPGSVRLLFPAMRELMGGDLQSLRPVVTVAFSSIEGFKELSAVSLDAARDVLQLHNAAVRETLSTCSGYECKEFNGSFMTTFAMPTNAVEWALTLQLALVAMPWPEDLLACEQAAVVLSPDNDTVLFRGLRCRVGIYAGPIDRVTPHPKTGRADYFGQPVNRAARLMTAAQGGQVVLDQSLLDDVLDEWRRRQEVRRLATIPSVEEGSPHDEGSLVAPSEMRTARSFVSAKSTNRLMRPQGLATGTCSAGASSTPSITNLPELSMHHLGSRGEAPTSGGHRGGGAATDGMPPSPFGSVGGTMFCKMLSNNAMRDYTTDGSVSPRGSAQRAMSGANSSSTTACGGAVAVAPSSATILPHAASNSNTNTLARSLERLLVDQRVQRSARSEPRIPRISRFGLGGLSAALRIGGRAAASSGACVSPRSGGHGGGGLPLPTASSVSLNVTTSSPSQWLPEYTSTPSASVRARSISFLNRSLGGGGGNAGGGSGGRVASSQRSMSHGVMPPRSPPFGSQANGGGSGGSAMAGLHVSSWLSHALMTRTSPGGSLHGSIAGGPSAGGAESVNLVPGLELQPADWDPMARGAATRARQRRRASIGAIVENMLAGARRTQGSSRGGAGGGSAGPSGSHAQEPSTHHHSRPSGSQAGWHTAGRSPSSRISPAAAAMRARLMPGSPHSAASGASGSGSTPGAAAAAAHGSTTSAFGSSAGLHVELPGSPSTSTALASPPSTASGKTLAVRRMASSPLGLPMPGLPPSELPTNAQQSLMDLEAVRRRSHGGGSGGVAPWSAAAPQAAAQGAAAQPPPSARPPGAHLQQHHRYHSLQHRHPGPGPEARHPRHATAHQHTSNHSSTHNSNHQVSQAENSAPQVQSLSPPRQPRSRRGEGPSHQPRQPELPQQQRQSPPHAGSTSDNTSALPSSGASARHHQLHRHGGILSSVAEGHTPSSGSTLDLDPLPSFYLVATHPLDHAPASAAAAAARLDCADPDGSGGSLRDRANGNGGGAAPAGSETASVYSGGDPSPTGAADTAIPAQLLSSRGSVMGAPGNGTVTNSVSVLLDSHPQQQMQRAGDVTSGIQSAKDSDRDRGMFNTSEAHTAATTITTSGGGGGAGQGFEHGSGDAGGDPGGGGDAGAVAADGAGDDIFAPAGGGGGGDSSIKSRASAPSSSTSLGFALVPAARLLGSELASPQPTSSAAMSTASSSVTRRMYDRAASAAASGLLADPEVMPSFAVNLLPRAAVDTPGGAAGGRGDGGSGAAGGSGSSMRSEIDALGASPSAGGGYGARGGFIAAPSPGRGFAIMHGNPVYGERRSRTGGAPIAEEDAANAEPEAESLELIATTASSRSLPPALMLRQSQAGSSKPPQQQQLCGVADSNGTMLLGMPPMLTQTLLPNGVKAATGGRRYSDGPHHQNSSSVGGGGEAGGGSGSAASLQLSAGGGSIRTQAGGPRRFSRNSSGTMHSVVVADSPVASEGYGGFGRSATHDDPVQPHASSPRGGGGGGGSLARQVTHGSKTTSWSLYGSTAVRLKSALMSSTDAAALAAAVASAPGQVGQGPSAPGQVGQGPSAPDPAPHGDSSSGTGARLSAGPPPGAFSAAAGRRRASSGAIGVSLRVAAEAAISQLHAVGHNSSSAAQQPQLPLTPSRALRKSTSSRGRRSYAESRSLALAGGSTTDSALAVLAAGASSVGGSPMNARGGPVRTTSLRPGRSDASGGGAFVLSPAVEQLAALVTQHGGLDLRGSPTLDRSIGTPRAALGASGGGGGSMPRFGVSDGGARGASLRRSAPGHPLAATVAAASGAGGHAAYASVSTSASGTYSISDALRTPTRSIGTAALAAAGSSSAPGPFHGGGGPGPSTSRHSAHYRPASLEITAMQLPAIHAFQTVGSTAALDAGGSSGGGPMGISRRSSAGSHALPPSGSPSHGLAPHYTHQQSTLGATTSSSPYSRYGTAESLTAPPVYALPQGPTISGTGVLPRAYRTGSYSIVAAALLGTSPSAPLGAPTSGSHHGTRAGMNRSSTPQLAAGNSSAETTPTACGPAVISGGPPVGNNTAPPGMSALHMARLRASNQSLPEDAFVSSALQSVSRELSRPSDPAAAHMSNPGAAHVMTRGSRWRSPRGQNTAAGDEAGGAAASGAGGGGGGAGAGAAGPSPDKLSHAPGSPEAAAGAAAAAAAAKENRPAVMAECYKITQQPAGGMGGSGNEVAQSITMIKYTNLKQELERAEEGEGDDVPVPTNMLLVPTVAVEVAIWSLGSFRLKGVTEAIKIVQVLPVELEGRLSILNKAGLNRGKARCIERRVACLEVITLQLPDVSQLSCVSMGAGGTPGASVDGGGGGPNNNMDGLSRTQSGEMTAAATFNNGQWLQPLNPSDGGAAGMAVGGATGGVGAGGRGPGVPIVLGHAASPSEAAARWGGMRGVPLREIESSEAGLPPISEVVTPVSSPTVRSREPMPPPSGAGAGLGHQLDGSSYNNLMARRRGFFPQPTVIIPDGPTSPDRSSAAVAGLQLLPPPTLLLPQGQEMPVAAVAHQAAAYPYGPSPQQQRPQQGRAADAAAGGNSNSHHHLPYTASPAAASAGAPPPYAYRAGGESLGSADGRVSAVSQGDRLSAQRGTTNDATARLSTGLLPMSLSYMAPRNRDIHSTYAAMVSAGMDVRSPDGSPVNTLPSPDGSADMRSMRGGYGAPHDDAAALGLPYNDAVATVPMFVHERTSASTITQPRSALVIDRSSSGFNHALSGSQTPAQAFTDRSSSGRYTSGIVPPGLTGTDRTSSGMVAPPLTATDRTTSGLPLMDWSSSGLHTASPLGPIGAEPVLSRQGSAAVGGGALQLPERLSPVRGTPLEAGTTGTNARPVSGSSLGAGSPGPSRFVRDQYLQQQQQEGVTGRFSAAALRSPPNGGGGSGPAGSRRLGGTRPLPDGCDSARWLEQGAAQQEQTEERGAEDEAAEGIFPDGGNGRATESPYPGAPPPGPVSPSSLFLVPPHRRQAQQAQQRMRGPYGDSQAPPHDTAFNGGRGAATTIQVPGSAAGTRFRVAAPHAALGYGPMIPAAAAHRDATSSAPRIGSVRGAGGGGGSLSTSPDSAHEAACANLEAHGSNAAAGGLDSNIYDITISMRSSMAGSAAGGRVSNAGLTAVESLRTFGLSHIPSSGQAEPTSASELLRPFSDGQSGPGGSAVAAARLARDGLGVGSGAHHWQRLEATRFSAASTSGSGRQGPGASE